MTCIIHIYTLIFTLHCIDCVQSFYLMCTIFPSFLCRYGAGLLFAYLAFVPFCEAGVVDTLSLQVILFTKLFFSLFPSIFCLTLLESSNVLGHPINKPIWIDSSKFSIIDRFVRISKKILYRIQYILRLSYVETLARKHKSPLTSEALFVIFSFGFSVIVLSWLDYLLISHYYSFPLWGKKM